MKPKTMILLIVAVGCGLGAAVMAQKMMNDRNPPVKLIKAQKDIAKWTTIKNDEWIGENFVLIEVPRDQVPPDILAKNPVQDLMWLSRKTKDHVIDKKMMPGDVLLPENVVEKNAGGLASALHRGYTAFTIRATADSATAGFIAPDDWVKVISVRKLPSGDKIPKVLMQNVRVAAVDNLSERGPKDEKAQAKPPATVTLEVTDEESKELKKAQEEGPLSLSLISFKDLEHLELEDRYKAENRKGEQEKAKSERPKLTDLIRPGFTAFGVKATAEGSAGGAIIPGNRVKVVGFRKVLISGNEKKKPFLLMKNIKVVAVDDVTEKNREDLAGIVAKTITLEVTEPEAKKLLESQEEAGLHLGLMSKSDLVDKSDPTGKTLKTDEQLDNEREGEKLPDFFSNVEEEKKPEKKEEKVVKKTSTLSILAGPASQVYQREGDQLAPSTPGTSGTNTPPRPPQN